MDTEEECISAREDRGVRQISHGHIRHAAEQERETTESEDADA